MNNAKLIEELKMLLRKGNAHLPVAEALADLPEELRGKKHKDLPYTIWQLAEHIRFTQYDILDFCRNHDYKAHAWPDDYWPENESPAEGQWEQCMKSIEEDSEAFIKLLEAPDVDLFAPIPHGDGQTLLREAMLIADHTSYHNGQIIVLRRLFGDWE